MKRKLILSIVAILLLLGMLPTAMSCSPEQPEAEESGELVPYDEARLHEYLAPVRYQGLTVSFDETAETKGEAIFRAVLNGAEVKEYPSEQTAYYEAQIRAEYRYLAQREELSYEDLLEIRGMTEESIRAEAKAMVKSDLVFLYITKDADIALSEAEKTEHYDRYADKYVEQYGFDRAYVDGYLREEIYEAMLFDKTMEYLILHNEVKNG